MIMTTEAIDSTVQNASDFDWATFLLGAPLKITVIIIGAIVVNLIIRTLHPSVHHRSSQGHSRQREGRKRRPNEILRHCA
jgi:hypothetical protein